MSRRLTDSGETPEEALRVRNANRTILHDLRAEFNEFKRGSHPETLAQLQREDQVFRQELQRQQSDTQAIRNELQQLKQQVQQLQASAQDVNSVKNDMRSLMGDTKSIKSELSSVKGAHQDFQRTNQEVQGMKTKLQTMEQKTPQLADKSELKKLESEHQRDLNELKKGVQSSDVLKQLQAKTDLTKMEFDDLRKQIYDRGLLAPKVEIPDDPEEPPAVGVVQLGEDVFTARLLIHLGFMKARKDEFLAERAASPPEMAATNSTGDRRTLTMGSGMQERDNSRGYTSMEVEVEEDDNEGLMTGCTAYPDLEDEEALAEFIDDSNVHGISDIEVTEGGVGHCEILYGWLFICLSTFALQALVVMILIQGAEDAGEGCLRKMPTRYEWWLLHLSKGLAIGVASILMGRELMDVVNYAMVSCLVEPHINFEMVFFATSRVVLAGLIGVANVLIFSYLKHPVSVWINMTALAFIGELGTGMLDVARRGVFGHHIMKTMTGINFELTFCDHYPRWFKSIRFMALAAAFVFGTICSMWAFSQEVDMCPVHHYHNGTHLLGPAPFGERGEGGGGGMPHEHHR